MLFRLLVAFIVIPLVELYLLLQMANYTSVAATILLVVITGIIGSTLARREGIMAWVRFQSALSEGRMPSREIQDGLMIVFAAALLLTPGLLTDLVGFTLLVPWGRDMIRRVVLSRYAKRFNVQFSSTATGPIQEDYGALHREERGSSYTIDAEAVQRKS